MAEIVYQIQKNNNEIIQIDVSEFKGRELINIRIWYQTQDFNSGDLIYKPTQKGITLDVSKYEDLKNGIERLGAFLNDRNSGETPDQPQILKDSPEEENNSDEKKDKEDKTNSKTEE